MNPDLGQDDMKRVNSNRLLARIRLSAVSALFVVGSVLSSVSAASETYYFHADHLGALQVLTNDAAEVVWQGRYEPFGEVVETVSEVEQNLRFPGQYLDRETGLHQNWYRDYSSVTGRYIQSDPVGLYGGMNTYVYAFAQPFLLQDVTGLAVGDWWDFPANIERAREIAMEELRAAGSSHNDLGDAMRHAQWQRRIVEETNSCVAWLVGTYHEIEGFVANGQPYAEFLMDMQNNKAGRMAARNGGRILIQELVTSPQTPAFFSPGTWAY